MIDSLRVIWVLMNFPCGKRFQPVLAEVVAALERHGQLRVEPEVRSKLMAMAAATIGRRLAGTARGLTSTNRGGTAPTPPPSRGGRR